VEERGREKRDRKVNSVRVEQAERKTHVVVIVLPRVDIIIVLLSKLMRLFHRPSRVAELRLRGAAI
jgi:hypothetical protein